MVRVVWEVLRYDPSRDRLDELLEALRERLVTHRNPVVIKIYYIYNNRIDAKVRELLQDEDDNDDPVISDRIIHDRLMN